MSDAVYPNTLPGITWPRKRTPVWKTSVSTTPSGREWRRRNALTPRYRYSLQYSFLRSAAAYNEFQALFGFFNARGGSAESFLFDDRDDNTAAAAVLGIGNGSQATWQLVRPLGGFAEPVFDTLGTPAVALDGVALNMVAGGDFAADTNADGVCDGLQSYSSGTATGVVFLVGGGAWGALQRCLATSMGSSATDQVGFRFVGDVAIKAGGQYTAAADIYSFNCSHSIEVDFYTAGGTYLGRIYSTWVGNGVSFSRRVATVVAPAGATRAAVYVYMHTATGANPEVRVDNVMLQPGAVATAFSNKYFSCNSQGLITIDPASSNGATITWSGQYYWRCRFDTDELGFEQFMSRFWKTGEVKLITVKP